MSADFLLPPFLEAKNKKLVREKGLLRHVCFCFFFSWKPYLLVLLEAFILTYQEFYHTAVSKVNDGLFSVYVLALLNHKRMCLWLWRLFLKLLFAEQLHINKDEGCSQYLSWISYKMLLFFKVKVMNL